MESVITIVFAANDTYIPIFGVALHSLITCSVLEREYKIFILNDGISSNHWKKIKAMERPNVVIESVDVSECMDEYDIPNVNHLSKETTYRLLIGKLFPNSHKVLYLDSDILIRNDVGRLYDVELDGYILGASRGRLFASSSRYITEELCIGLKNYFNAGVLLINVPLYNQYQIGEKGLKMLSEKIYHTQDQDVLNILCQSEDAAGMVKILDEKWNYEWEHLAVPSMKPVIDTYREGSLEIKDDAYIIHYTSARKPWNYPEVELAELWWAQARQTSFYEELLELGIYQRFLERWISPSQIFKDYLFPWKLVKAQEKIILYGAGVVGRAFFEQSRVTEYCQIIAVCDKNAPSVNGFAVPVITQSELVQFPDYRVLIAVESEKTASAIKTELINCGISVDRILWRNYRRRVE